MTADVIPLRPRRRARRRPGRPGRVPTRLAQSSPVPVVLDGPVVEWDPGRGLYVAVCGRCTDTATFTRLDQAHEWAETHRCDPELAALLDHITRGAA